MEESQEAMQINVEQVEESNGDKFYEEIEAPKFVDLNAPDPYLPGDDRYWFCLRVGCDQKHEEEMDSQAIYKNFVLRVMAARSPNIRLRKALHRKDLSSNVKCPQTVPAKSSKPKVSRLALISSLSKRMVDPKVQVKPISKQSVTPNAKAKQSSVAAKAVTTPGNKKRLSNPDAFRSVRNPKAISVVVTKNRVVAKALVFHSPKKSVRTRVSPELDTPVKTLCAGMKKLEINGGKNSKKHVMGYSRPLPSDASRKQLRGREVKSRVYDVLQSQSHRSVDAKMSNCLKKRKKEKKLHQDHSSVHQEGIVNDFIDIEIQKSRNSSLGVCSTSKGEGNVHEGPLTTVEISKSSLSKNKLEALSDASRNDLNSLSNPEERSLEDDDVSRIQVPSEEGNRTEERKGQEEKMKSSLEKGANETVESDDTKYILTSDNKENDGEVMESDDKENASDENRESALNAHLGRKTLGKLETPKNKQKISRAISKLSKESSSTFSTGAQQLKHRKPKPTNPKPFRLRTDERRILKESSSEKKLHHAPLKEITSVPSFAGENSEKKHQKAFQRNEKSLVQTAYGNDASKGNEKKTNNAQMDQTQNETSSLKTSKERVVRKLSTAPQRHTMSSQQKLVMPLQEYSQKEATERLANSLKRTKSPFVRQLTRPQGPASMVSIMTPGQLSAIKETSSTILRPREAAKPGEGGASVVNKASASAISRPSLQGKRFTTIPKEPHFHTIHVPKSCTRRVT